MVDIRGVGAQSGQFAVWYGIVFHGRFLFIFSDTGMYCCHGMAFSEKKIYKYSSAQIVIFINFVSVQVV
ncbi:hypothetical protein DGMP_26570 [Desulfomarina profundi]|uniref:Uncharacterized protein n=1 Tax=Desulfomarina profundi TaxID=2772557 RepID=A0A8D5FPF2_9BACT|nr:hypothetical protein DGMP_26570 [Desulfomarina profundi]